LIGDTMGIPVHDHLIIAGTEHTSLAERGVIE
jgi:DNA repair protein RadC